jgi:DNA adenine methylase
MTTFIKWAGGKSSLLTELDKYIPNNIETYYEPFLGGGSVFFHVANKVKKAYLSDVNPELVNTYNTVKSNVEDLIKDLSNIESEYLSLQDEKRKHLYLSLREEYNSSNELNVRKAALFIALNKTCFNGLYRVNSKNKFNVPIGSYKKPKICDKPALLKTSKLLNVATIECKRYSDIVPTINSFIYLDPPYRPISKTSSFNSYSSDAFDDNEQIKLADYCKSLDGTKFLLSNSDPKNTDPNDNFFDDLYKDFTITRIKTKRMIGANGGRPDVTELIIHN